LRIVRRGIVAGLIVLACTSAVYFWSAEPAELFISSTRVLGGPEAISKRPTVDPEFLQAAALMVVPPYGTPLVLQVDPRRPRAIMEKGEASYRGAEDAQVEGARLIHEAAVLGFGPARQLIVRSYPSTRVIRMTSPAPDTVRFALDFYTEGARNFEELEQLERKEIAAFATHLVEAVRDDSRLRVEKRFARLFAQLATVPEICAARSASVHTAPDPECSPAVQQLVLAKARGAGLVGRDDESRRQALWALQMSDKEADPAA